MFPIIGIRQKYSVQIFDTNIQDKYSGQIFKIIMQYQHSGPLLKNPFLICRNIPHEYSIRVFITYI